MGAVAEIGSAKPPTLAHDGSGLLGAAVARARKVRRTFAFVRVGRQFYRLALAPSQPAAVVYPQRRVRHL